MPAAAAKALTFSGGGSPGRRCFALAVLFVLSSCGRLAPASLIGMCGTTAKNRMNFSDDHFALFELPRAFRVDAAALDARYREIVAKVHPDKFAHAGDAEQRLSLQWATRINEAYQTLKTAATGEVSVAAGRTGCRGGKQYGDADGFSHRADGVA